MNSITLQDEFIGAGCEGEHEPEKAVTVGGGAIWGPVYDTVTTKEPLRSRRRMSDRGRRGPDTEWWLRKFSKAYGMAAASLLEAEIVTADGAVRSRQRLHESGPVLGNQGRWWWSLGVVTRLTLRTHSLPETAATTIKATSDAAFRRLILQIVSFYSENLLNPHWGEQIVFRPGNVLAIAMVFQGLDQQRAEIIWRPFFDWLAASPGLQHRAAKDLSRAGWHFWDPGFLRKLPDLVIADDRPCP